MPEKIDPNLGLSYGWDEGEDGWSPGMDKNLTRLGAFVGLEVISADVADPPGSPAEGDRYLVAAPATGAWTGREDDIAVYLESTWTFHAPSLALRAYLRDEMVMATWDGARWLRGERFGRIVDALGALHSLMGVTSALDGVFFVRNTEGPGGFDPGDGGIIMRSGRLELHGSQVELPEMSHGESGGLPLYVGPTGQLFLGPAPPNLWKQETTDPLDYTTLGTGTGTGPWVEMTGSAITLAQNIEISHELLVTSTLYIQEQSGTRDGQIEIWWGPAGLGDPGAVTPDATFLVSGGQDGLSVQSFTRTATQQILSGSNVTVYARRANGEHNQYAPQLLGSLGPHAHVLQRVG